MDATELLTENQLQLQVGPVINKTTPDNCKTVTSLHLENYKDINSLVLQQAVNSATDSSIKIQEDTTDNAANVAQILLSMNS